MWFPHIHSYRHMSELVVTLRSGYQTHKTWAGKRHHSLTFTYKAVYVQCILCNVFWALLNIETLPSHLNTRGKPTLILHRSWISFSNKLHVWLSTKASMHLKSMYSNNGAKFYRHVINICERNKFFSLIHKNWNNS